MGDRICVMKDGIIQQFDIPQVLYSAPCNLFVAGFIGSPQMNFMEAQIAEENGKLYAKFAGTALPMTREKSEKLRDYIGKTVILGIRPEDFLPAGGKEAGTITAYVDLVEPMGAAMNLYLQCDEKKMVVRMPGEYQVKEETECTLAVKEDKIHVFDKDTQLAICH